MQSELRHIFTPLVWGLLAGLTGLAGYIPYLRDAWRRETDPDPAAWLIWAVEYSILLAVQAAQNPPWAALSLAALQLVGTVVVFAVLAVRGGWRFGGGRWAVLGCTVAAMTLWRFTHAPGLAMLLLLAAEGAGMALVIANVYHYPGRETLLTWWAFVAAGLLDLPALGAHAPRLLYAYPVFFIVLGGGVLLADDLGGARLAARRQRCLPRYGRRSLLPMQAAVRQACGGADPGPSWASGHAGAAPAGTVPMRAVSPGAVPAGPRAAPRRVAASPGQPGRHTVTRTKAQ